MCLACTSTSPGSSLPLQSFLVCALGSSGASHHPSPLLIIIIIFIVFVFVVVVVTGLHKLWQPCSRAARKWKENEEMKRKWRENEEMKRKWRENEEMEREIHSQDFLILCLFLPSLSISYIINCHILSQNVKYGTFVTNVTKN